MKRNTKAAEAVEIAAITPTAPVQPVSAPWDKDRILRFQGEIYRAGQSFADFGGAVDAIIALPTEVRAPLLDRCEGIFRGYRNHAIASGQAAAQWLLKCRWHALLAAIGEAAESAP